MISCAFFTFISVNVDSWILFIFYLKVVASCIERKASRKVMDLLRKLRKVLMHLTGRVLSAGPSLSRYETRVCGSAYTPS
jgi:hypothetical protein